MKKIIISCPITHSKELRQKVLDAWAWMNWNYSHCSWMYELEGTFIPGDLSKPFSWKKWKMEFSREHKIETTCEAEELENIIKVIKKYHPYETPHIEAFDINLY